MHTTQKCISKRIIDFPGSVGCTAEDRPIHRDGRCSSAAGRRLTRQRITIWHFDALSLCGFVRPVSECLMIPCPFFYCPNFCQVLVCSSLRTSCHNPKLNSLLLNAVSPSKSFFRLLTFNCLDNQVLLPDVEWS